MTTGDKTPPRDSDIDGGSLIGERSTIETFFQLASNLLNYSEGCQTFGGWAVIGPEPDFSWESLPTIYCPPQLTT